ncbi:MAG: response regulator transcription factor [Anaerolineales bacterium]|nr:response regulator transcription factor [Anaerolineales bacterium]
MEPIRTVVIASTLAMRAGLRALLESDPAIEVVAEAADLSDPAALIGDIDVLAAAGAPSLSDVVAERLASQDNLVALVVMTDEPESAGYLPGLTLRAWGLLPLDASAEELIAAVRATHEGLVACPPALLQNMLPDPLPPDGEDGDELDELTEREVEVLILLAQGLANKQIAGELGISEHTVKFHVSSIYGKLGANNRAEAVRIGARSGLIPL